MEHVHIDVKRKVLITPNRGNRVCENRFNGWKSRARRVDLTQPTRPFSKCGIFPSNIIMSGMYGRCRIFVNGKVLEFCE